MGMFLNSIEPYDKYKTITKGLYFVDKTELLEELIPALEQEQRFFCITRPRRFGKTVMANMIASFFEKSEGGSDIFDRLKISEYPKYKEHLNKHDVVYIDFSEMPKECDSYKKYISRIEEGIYYDLREKYLDTKDYFYFKEIRRLLPSSYLYKSTITMNYENIRNMYFQRKNHKLTEWSKSFIDWARTLPYAQELIFPDEVENI